MSKTVEQEFLETLKDPTQAQTKQRVCETINNPNTTIENVEYIELHKEHLTIKVQMRLDK